MTLSYIYFYECCQIDQTVEITIYLPQLSLTTPLYNNEAGGAGRMMPTVASSPPHFTAAALPRSLIGCYGDVTFTGTKGKTENTLLSDMHVPSCMYAFFSKTFECMNIRNVAVWNK